MGVAGGSGEFSGQLKNGSGSGAITKTGAGTEILSGSNIYTGTTVISGGTLQLGNGGANGSLSASSTITNNAVLAFNRSNVVTQGTDFSTAAISGSGGVVQAGSGALIFTSSNTYVGATTIASGTLALGNSGTTGSIPSSGAVVNNGTLVFNRTNTLTQGADFPAVSGSGRIVQAGIGMTVLGGSNSYTGGTVVSSGTLQVGNSNAMGTGGLTVNGGMLDLHGSNVAVTNLGGAGGAISNAVSGTGTLATTVSSGTSNYAGAVTNGSGSVVLDKEGAGTLILSGSIRMAGLTAGNGSVELTQSGSVGAVSVATGATLSLAAHSGSAGAVLDVSSLTFSGFPLAQAYIAPDAVAGPALLHADGLGAGSDTALVNSPSSVEEAPAIAPAEAVPEPGTFGMIIGGMGLLAFGRRLRRRSA